MRLTSLFILSLILFPTTSLLAGEHSLGLGVHYFYTLDDMDNDWGDSFHENGLGLNGSYKYKPIDHFGFQFELQAFPDGYYDAEIAVSPRILAILGRSFYIGAGIAWNYLAWEATTEALHQDKNWSDAYYILRAGFEIPIIVPDLRLDIKTDYELNEWNEVEDFDSDALTFGVGLRMAF